MFKGMKKIIVTVLVVVTMVMSALPTFAASSKYGEEKDLYIVNKSYYTETRNGNHRHEMITASNGVNYLLYDSCMEGMIGRTPTNHLSTVTINGVKYTLRNYAQKGKICDYANVIKRVDNAPVNSSIDAELKKEAQYWVLNNTSKTINVGETARFSISYLFLGKGDENAVKWKSSNTGIASVKNGLVSAKKTGTVTITAVYGETNVSFKVNVKAPLKSISLNKTSATLDIKKSLQLSVKYNPGNTTDSKVISWSSSNNNVATVSGGKVTAKKAGTAVIQAKVGSKTAKCKITVKGTTSSSSSKASANSTSKATGVSSKGSYKNVEEAYTLLNKFRTTKANQWYWNSSNTGKVNTPGLKAVKKDAEMEKIAKLRAKEQWIMYYEKGKLTHNRPDGSNWVTAYPATLKSKGENLGWGHTTCQKVVLDPNYGWAETNAKYSGQAHRRTMLNKSFTKVGIACYEKDGKTCWAMCFGN